MKKLSQSIVLAIIFFVLYSIVMFFLDGRTPLSVFLGNLFLQGESVAFPLFYVPAIAFAVSFYERLKTSVVIVILLDLAWAIFSSLVLDTSSNNLAILGVPWLSMWGFIGSLSGWVCQMVYAKIAKTA